MARKSQQFPLVGIVHCDIKPQNILMDGERIVLCDFGMSKYEGELVDRINPLFAAPELNQKQQVKASTSMDVWALGCIMLYMLNNNALPWENKTMNLNQELIKEITDSKQGENILKIIKQSIEIDPAKRCTVEEISKMFKA